MKRVCDSQCFNSSVLIVDFYLLHFFNTDDYYHNNMFYLWLIFTWHYVPYNVNKFKGKKTTKGEKLTY